MRFIMEMMYCPYCGMDNPNHCGDSEPIITTTSNEVISVEDNPPSPPSLQSMSTGRVSLDKTTVSIAGRNVSCFV
jgi:hypothetical protein